MARGKKKEILTPEERLQTALVPESEQLYPVPANWCWTKVGVLSDLYRGVSYKKQDAHAERQEQDCLILRGGNVLEGAIETETSDNVYVNRNLVQEDQLLQPYDVIIVSSTGSSKAIGRAGVSYTGYDNVAFGAFLTLVRPNDGIVKPFIAYYFQSDIYRNRIRELAAGVNINNIKANYITESPIPLPPFSEQQRIVDRIESLFAKLDEAKQKAQDALDSFETRKAAILHKAFTGELTAKWRKEHGVGMETWSSCKLIDILVEKPRNGYSPKPVDYVTACKSMTLSATTTGVFKPEFFKYIDEEIPENSHLWLTPGDILIQRANSLEKVGMSAIYTGAEHEFIYPDLMMKLTVKEPNNKHYIDYYLKTDEILNYFRSNATGTAGNMPKINQKVVSETPLILPETQEQAEIVRLLDDLLAREQQAKEAAEGVLEQIDLIKKAILARAFRGELGTNDPSEESAVELLKQISSY